MKLDDLRNRARDGIEPERELNSPLLPQKTFLGIDFGISNSILFFVTKSRDINRNTSLSSMQEYERLIEVDWNELEL